MTDINEDLKKENKKLLNENKKLKTQKQPFTEASMSIEYLIDDNKKIIIGAKSKIVDSVETTHEMLYFKLLSSLENVINITVGKE
jgi:hypothetical protein